MERTDPAAWQPPLRLWGHIWRLALMLLISALAWLSVIQRELEIGAWFVALDLAIGVAAFVVVFWRRRWPVPIAFGLGLVSAVSAVSAGPGLLALMSLATRRRNREIAPVAAVTLVCWLVFELIADREEDPIWFSFLFAFVILVAVVGWGMYVGSRRELLYTLRLRAERAEAERDARAREARATERARIAREMHDVLAHRITQISMHAGAVSYRDDLTADEMRDSVGVIRRQAHDALTDLRAVLGVLRDEDGPLTRPQPTYCDLPTLIDEAREAGARIDFEDRLADADIGPDNVPDGVGRTLYRIVQEGITNARKHAPGAVLQIRLDGTPDEGVSIAMRNPLGLGPTDTPGAGLGLIGLAERIEHRGGRLDHGLREDDHGPVFALRAWLPWAT